MKNNLTITNKNSKLALNKAKSLLDITNKLLSKKESGQLAQVFKFIPFLREKGHSDNVTSVAITPDGKRVVSGSWDGTIKIWDIQSGECLDTLEGHLSGVISVAITPDGERVVTGSWDGTIKIWDMQSGECLDTLKGHSSDVESVAITPDGKRVVTGSSDNTIKIWDMQSGECLDTLEGHSGWVNSVAITPGGERVVSGSWDETIKIWDIQSGECLDTLKGHLSGVISVAITPGGERVVTGSWDGTIKIWDMQSGECIYTIDYNSKLSIDKDGYFRGELEGIKEYVRVSEAPLSQRKLTDEEIEHFRKKGDFLKMGKIVPKPYVESVVMKKRDIAIIDIDEDEIPF